MMFSKKINFLNVVLLSIPTLLCTSIFAQENLAPVTGFTQSFITNNPIANANITVLETGQTGLSNEKGEFGPINYPVGKSITLRFKKVGYKTTQSATVIVPPDGLNSPYNNITFQVPAIELYYLLIAIVGAKVDPNSCHVTTTIIAYHKTLHDVPQGEPGATITLTPYVNEIPFYFDIFKDGPLKGQTNPFTRGLTTTSEDGGVALFNLPPRDQPYTISAVKSGVTFTSAQFICRKGEFINISPPQGPMATV